MDLCYNPKLPIKTTKLFKEDSFAAPEAILYGTQNLSTDIYSFGLLIYYIITKEIYCEYLELNSLPPCVQNIVSNMLTEYQEQRPTADSCYCELRRIFSEL